MNKCIISENAPQGILRSINHNKYTKLYYQGQFAKLGMLGAIKKSHKRRK